MLEASYRTSCYKVYFTKNAANTKDSTLIIFLPMKVAQLVETEVEISYISLIYIPVKFLTINYLTKIK
jgi:hypothetical protein